MRVRDLASEVTPFRHTTWRWCRPIAQAHQQPDDVLHRLSERTEGAIPFRRSWLPQQPAPEFGRPDSERLGLGDGPTLRSNVQGEGRSEPKAEGTCKRSLQAVQSTAGLGVDCRGARPRDINQRRTLTQSDHGWTIGVAPADAWARARASSSSASCKGRIAIGHDSKAGPCARMRIVCRRMVQCSPLGRTSNQ